LFLGGEIIILTRIIHGV